MQGYKSKKVWILFYFCTLLLFYVSSVSATVTFDAATDATVAVGEDHATVVHTVGGGCTNPILVATAYNSDGSPAALSSFTSTAGAMTEIATVNLDDSAHVLRFYYRAGATGSQTVTVTYAATQSRILLSARSYCGVDGGTSIGTPATATGYDNPITVDVTSAAGEMVIDAVGDRADLGDTLAVGAGQTQQSNFIADISGVGIIAGSDEAGAATTTMSWVASPSGQYWAMIGVALKPSAAAAVVLRRRPMVME